MKKYVSILIALLILAVTCYPCYAEALSPAPVIAPNPPVTVDVTQLIIAIMTVVFNALLAWIIKAVVPPAKKWLDTHTTIEQQENVWNLVKRLVEAAEKTITGFARGSERMAWVKAELTARGFNVDTAMIEAAVKEMENAATIQFLAATKNDLPDTTDADLCGPDYCDLVDDGK